MNTPSLAWRQVIGFLVITIVALIVAAFRLGQAFNGPSASPPSGSGAIATDASNRVGIGTTTPQTRLTVVGIDGTTDGLRIEQAVNNSSERARILMARSRGTAASKQAVVGGDLASDILTMAYDGSAYSSISLIRTIVGSVAAGDVTGHMGFYTRPSGGGTLPVERMRITDSGHVGIATTTPSVLLSVGDATSSLVAVFGGGSGKINAGTIDPVYRIGGEQYATYLPSMTGVKEETAGTIALTDTGKGLWTTAIDFRNLPRGSDLWLFSKTTALDRHFSQMSVLLTPGFEGTAWYEKDVTRRTLKIFARPVAGDAVEVSYRFTAPRFDAASWPNENHDVGSGGFVIDE